jgi:phage gp45-like
VIEELAARIKNVFAAGSLEKRYDDDTVQVKTLYERVVETGESFPYGFKARAKQGRVFVFCPGGDLDSVEILPVLEDEYKGPELKPGDAALYAGSGGWIVTRDDGTVELFGKDYGGLIKVNELKSQLAKLTARVDGIIQALQNAPTASQDGGAAYKAGIATALNALSNKEDFSGIASDKVYHGSGN